MLTVYVERGAQPNRQAKLLTLHRHGVSLTVFCLLYRISLNLINSPSLLFSSTTAHSTEHRFNIRFTTAFIHQCESSAQTKTQLFINNVKQQLTAARARCVPFTSLRTTCVSRTLLSVRCFSAVPKIRRCVHSLRCFRQRLCASLFESLC